MADDKRGGNGGMKLDIGDLFDIGDLLMLIETLNYASTRTRMSSGPGNEAEADRFHFLSEALAKLSPLPKGDRNMGYTWFKTIQAAKSCAYYGAYLVEDDASYGKKPCHLDVVCGDLSFRVVKNGVKEEILASIPEVNRFIRDVAPVMAEPLVGLNGLVDIGTKLKVRTKGSQDWENAGRLDEVTAAMDKALGPATPFVFVVEASGFWAVDTVVEARFLVPSSNAEDVVAHVAELNAEALAEYSKKYRSQDFTVARTPT